MRLVEKTNETSRIDHRDFSLLYYFFTDLLYYQIKVVYL